MLREGGRGAAAARAGPKAQVNAVRTTVIVYNTRKHGAEAEVAKCIERPAPRSKWMASRGLRAVWEGETLVRKVFRALQLWVAMAGPDGLRRHREERAARAPGAAAQEEHRDGAEAFDAWAKWGACLRLGRGLRATGSAASGALEEAEVRARKRLVWLRHASFNPEATRAKAAAAEQAAAAKAAAFAAALAAKRAAEAARRAAKVAARRAAAHVRLATALARAAITQGLAEDAAVRSGAGSLAAGRGQRRARPKRPTPPSADHRLSQGGFLAHRGVARRGEHDAATQMWSRSPAPTRPSGSKRGRWYLRRRQRLRRRSPRRRRRRSRWRKG